MNRAWIVLGLFSFFDAQATVYFNDNVTKKLLKGEWVQVSPDKPTVYFNDNATKKLLKGEWVQMSPDKHCLVDKAGNEHRCMPSAEFKSHEKNLKALREEQQQLLERQRSRGHPGPYQNPPALWPAPLGRHSL